MGWKSIAEIRLATTVGVALVSSPAWGSAEPLRRVRIDAPDPAVVAHDLETRGYDVLHGSVTSGSFDLAVSVEELTALQAQGFVLQDVARGRPLSERQPFATTGYPDLKAVTDALRAAEAKFPSIARVVDLTQALNQRPTFEGRHIYALKISDRVDQDEDEPAALVVSTHHARELVTPVIALTAIDRLTAGYGRDPAITAVVDEYEIWIAPVWNPDGYSWVFTNDNFWRKNRRNGRGVDLNRNYPQGWTSRCSGSTSWNSNTYKGPSAASEPETQTMMEWSKQRRFAKVIDFHSSGQEVLYAYRCTAHPFEPWWRAEAVTLANASGYRGSVRLPSAEGEHYQWQLAQMGAYAFLVETATRFQPPFATAVREAEQVWSGILQVLQRPFSVQGFVTDAATGAPLTATISLPDTRFLGGETYGSGGKFGRFDLILPEGVHRLRFEVPGLPPEERTVQVSATESRFLAVLIGDNLPPSFSAMVDLPPAPLNRPYEQDLLTRVKDPNPRDPQTFTKVSGPAWIAVDSGGRLSGTPSAPDLGLHRVKVRVTDSAGQSDESVLNLQVVDTGAPVPPVGPGPGQGGTPQVKPPPVPGSGPPPLPPAPLPPSGALASQSPVTGGCSTMRGPGSGAPSGWALALLGGFSILCGRRNRGAGTRRSVDHQRM